MTDRELMQAALDALSAMLTHMGMDEDEWNKPTFDQARASGVALRERLARPSAVLCKGIPRRGCDYLAYADTLCNKCGQIHHHHQMVATFNEAAAKVARPEAVPQAECPRNELVTALHTLASHYENALGALRSDAEALRKAEGDIAHAMKIAAKHNQNGPGCAAPAVPLTDEPCEWFQDGDDSDMWQASCGKHRYFRLDEGSPSDNKMTHCCYCGKTLVSEPYTEDNDD